jgi:DNA-binding beta-propeller fold protein YncE
LFLGVLAGCAQKPAEKPAEKPTVVKKTHKARIFTNGHGGHLSVVDIEIDPRTKEVRVAAGPARLKAQGYGSDKASHAVSISKDGKTLYWAALDGTIAEINLVEVGLSFDKTPWGKLKQYKTYVAKNVEWKELGGSDDNLHCGSAFSPDGKLLYVSSIASGAVLVYDTKAHKKVDKIPVDAFLCMTEPTRDGKYLYAANMASGVLNKVNLKTGEVEKKIDLTGMNGYFLHIGELEPTGRYVWVTAANEFKEGKPYNIPVEGATGIGEGYLIMVDTVKDEPVESIKVPGNPHDLTFTKDGRFVIVSIRHPPSDPTSSAIIVLDAQSKQLLKIKDMQSGAEVSEFDTCNACHKEIGVDLSGFVDPETQVLVNLGLLEHPESGIALQCGIDAAWAEKVGLGCG